MAVFPIQLSQQHIRLQTTPIDFEGFLQWLNCFSWPPKFLQTQSLIIKIQSFEPLLLLNRKFTLLSHKRSIDEHIFIGRGLVQKFLINLQGDGKLAHKEGDLSLELQSADIPRIIPNELVDFKEGELVLQGIFQQQDLGALGL